MKKKILSLLRGVAGEYGDLVCDTIDDSLIRVYALVGLLADEKVGNKFDDTTRRIRVELTKKISMILRTSDFKSSILEFAEDLLNKHREYYERYYPGRALRNRHE